MIIAIDLTSLSYHITGIERYAACLTEKLLERDKNNQYYLIFRSQIFEQLERFVDNERVKAVVLEGKTKIVFLQLVLPKCLKKIKADRYLFFAFTSPFFFSKKGIYNTIHDMGAWDSGDSMKLFQKIYWKIMFKRAAKVSEGIITVSEYSKSRITKILKLPEKKVRVVYSAIYEGVTKDYGFTFNQLKEEYNLPNKYIMTLSTLEPRKNMEILLKAFTKVQERVNYDLVLVGRKGWKMDEIINKYNTEKRIHITGFVDDKHLSVIYKNAMCFVFPSLYEGFGLPPVEALALGTPVISSDAASMPEILREQAVYFRNNSEEQLSELLLSLENNIKQMARKLSEEQLKDYQFENSAKKLLDIIS